MLIGLFDDILTLLGFIAKHFGLPMRFISRNIHKIIRHHPAMKSKHAELYIAAALGVLVIMGTVAIQDWYHSQFFHGSLKIAEASAACPIWEVINKAFRRG